MNFILRTLLILVSFGEFFSATSQESLANEDSLKYQKLDFIELANKVGLDAKAYEVTTEDGYVLTVHRIIGKGQTVLLQHGLLDSSDGFMIRGNLSLPVALHNEGYDVWLGNFRGNRYSRKHTQLNPDTDKTFWDFSLHEHGMFDMPAVMDFILKETDNEKISVIGHSEGNAVFYVLGSMRPEYNSKIKVLIALAPIAFLNNLPTPNNLIIDNSPILNDMLKVLGKEEVLNDQSALNELLKLACKINDQLCDFAIDLVVGSDPDEVKNFLDVVVTYYPAGTSRKNLWHISQISLAKSFRQFDYGLLKNLKIYRRATPPKYDLSKVTMYIELFVGKKDKLATVENVQILNSKLPNSNVLITKHDKMNHIDFLLGEHMYQYLFPDILKSLKKNSY